MCGWAAQQSLRDHSRKGTLWPRSEITNQLQSLSIAQCLSRRGRERERRLQGQQGLCCPHNWAKGSLDSQVSSLVPASLLSRNGKVEWVDENVSCQTFIIMWMFHASSIKVARSKIQNVLKSMTALWVCGKLELKRRFIILTQTPAQTSHGNAMTSAEITRGDQWHAAIVSLFEYIF